MRWLTGLVPFGGSYGINGNWPIGGVPSGKLIGTIVESSDPAFAVGERVKCSAGWRSLTWVRGSDKSVERLDAEVPPEIYLGIAGSGGRSALLPLEHLPAPSKGQTGNAAAASTAPPHPTPSHPFRPVRLDPILTFLIESTTPLVVALISSAAGAVGIVLVQLLKLRGVTVVGMCGTEDKVDVLASLGVASFNYKAWTVLWGRCSLGS